MAGVSYTQGMSQTRPDFLSLSVAERIQLAEDIWDSIPAAVSYTHLDVYKRQVEIGAIAQILENVLGVGERRLPRPRHTFAAHMGEGVGAAVHPRHHVICLLYTSRCV